MKTLFLLFVAAALGAMDAVAAVRNAGGVSAPLGSCGGPRPTIASLSSFETAKAAVHAGTAVPHSRDLYRHLYWSLDEARAERRGGWRCAPLVAPFADAAYVTGVPVEVLAAIALNESVRAGTPWPWTLNIAGRAVYFGTRVQAYRAAKRLLSKGMTNFDIGIMQISWKHNGWRFTNAWDALQPSINIATAGRILAENYRISRSWRQSVTWYHTRNRARGQRYWSRFAANLRVVQAQKYIETRAHSAPALANSNG